MGAVRSDTRKAFVAAAKRLFAERGFYGVSIAAIADELGLTKQALLHHFGSKEKLYSAVLADIAERFMGVVDAPQEGDGPAGHMAATLTAMHRYMSTESEDARIILRELLDNPVRAPHSRKWFLRPFLDALAGRARKAGPWRGAPEAEVFAAMYQLVGGINYFAVSGPTLASMYGTERLEAVTDAYPDAILRLCGEVDDKAR